MPVIYEARDESEYKIIPAPFVTVSKEYIRTKSSTAMSSDATKTDVNGPLIGSTFRISLRGTLTSHMGSPLVGVTGSEDREFYDGAGYPADTDTSSGGDGDGGSWDFGSPSVSGSTVESDNEHFKSILQKQLALRELFSHDGGKLTISTPTYKPFVCYPRIQSIDFDDSGVGDQGWNRTVDYTIELQVDRITGLPGPDGKIDEDWDHNDFSLTVGSTTYDRVYLEGATEDWAIEFNDRASRPSDDGDDSTMGEMWTFRVSHNLSATGKLAYESDPGGSSSVLREAWENAKIWVQSRLKGPDGYGAASSYSPTNSSAFGITGVAADPTDGYDSYDHVRSENTSELEGTYSVTETWLLSKNPFIEDFNVSTRYNVESGVRTVGIDGSIQGLETRDYTKMDDDYDIDNKSHITKSKYRNAKDRFDELVASNEVVLRGRIRNLTESPSTILELTSSSNTRNKTTGSISYSYEYVDDGDCGTSTLFDMCSAGIQSLIKKSSVTINFTNPTDIFAPITVLGRGGSSYTNYNGTGTAFGPVLQDIGTTSVRKISVAIEVTMEKDCATINIATGNTKQVVDCVADFITNKVKPSTSTYKVFLSSDTESWNPKTGKYTRAVTFDYGYCP